VNQIVEVHQLLESWPATDGQSVSNSFVYTCPDVRPYHAAVLDARYLHSLAACIARLAPQRYLAIGGLLGTTEAFAITHFGWDPDVIVICDSDDPEYNEDREMGAWMYRNICGQKYAGFRGQYVHVRDSSDNLLAKDTISRLGPFDMIYVDGKHTEASVESDLSLASVSSTPESIILAHDIDLPNTGVGTAYARWCQRHSEFMHLEAHQFPYGMGILKRCHPVP
jgi:hypothetical protein